MGVFDKFKIEQKLFAEDYLKMLFRCLPPGVIWRFRKYINAIIIQDVISGTQWQDTYTSEQVYQDAIETAGSGDLFSRLLSCFAEELARFDAFVWDLFNQIGDPGAATTLLPDWEEQLGLPEPCYANLPLTTEERQVLAHAKYFYVGRTPTVSFYEEYAASLGYDITVEEFPTDLNTRFFGVAQYGYERFGGTGSGALLRITINSGISDNTLLKCIFNRIRQAHIIIDWVEL